MVPEYRDAEQGPQVTEGSESGAGRLCGLSDIPDGGALGLEAAVGGEIEALVLLRRGGRVHAFLNVCPHAGRRLDWAPERFLVSDGLLVCAAHGASFVIPEGACVAGPCRGDRLREVPVAVQGDDVCLVRAE